MISTAPFVSLLLFLLNAEAGVLNAQYPKLLVVSYDAFRFDYFKRNMTPFMSQLKAQGTHADYMMNIFVTKTFPNHHTMATGFYAETHGVVDNEFYNNLTHDVTKYSYKLFHYNNDILPIWTVNEKSGEGRRSGTMMWPGSVYEYQGTKPSFALQFNDTISFEDRIDTLMSWFVHPTNPINFGILYIEEPDYHGHAVGINSVEFNEILQRLDNITRYLHDKVDHYGLTDLNIIHLSDHGMASVTIERIINLTNYINASDYTFVGTSPGLHIFPHPGKEEQIYQKLKSAAEQTRTFKVYKREDIPKKYHYGDNSRVGPIFVIAEVGYAFQNLYDAIEYYKKKFNVTINNQTEFGLHGYNNEDEQMHPFFFASGPAFIPGCKLDPFNNTDLFPLFCKILDLKCPVVNGTLSHVTKCLRTQSTYTVSSFLSGTIITASILCVLTVLALLTWNVRYWRKRRLGFTNMDENQYRL
ncbi:PREDICTED: bis(5'-adenosyl)-triphosphatase enpp4-like [Dinoponera quadriceps]|uniref:Bis(5'-adenosyl)-triphosphatase enpp4-like n=1 Tax=Dinoponera quadriceps TaxID=609295 RepID=A0A6P3XAD4_DINQU|nr:PREDICTED: bis(5'-adenosyl)-triphosphatase enpp4-like [Dinoponera quadriceps]XP_014474848.1 PREDICTED: bis(5'-adenosyl)-triphosphatase enpp4-like [Dinoponera quadriceps]XP_014474849.1 PREDICTED: bis(5'-adenosyl)-triphosphatase enpp4-like [Dinoponera quadriceps]XP_014474850.1 PREDICTED: bis(5'-adenosyl)-triphosphatase enpp4-like [Dinoponera quadriceps]XP_014474851.1 PREDICTED: bis(5'-adenosyl)-triphosphatase enpp4-like [Dinoponera quadriceps]